MAAFVYLTPDKTSRDPEPRIAMRDISERSCDTREKRCFFYLCKNCVSIYSVNRRKKINALYIGERVV